MKFLHPAFLFALSALAIPVIIHLFNFRKFKKLYFTNVRFLKEVKQETQSRSRLKHLLVLLSRLLAIAFLVFAFSQPYIPAGQGKDTTGKKVIGIYLDNSFSMEAAGENGELLEEARSKAIKIAMAYDVSDQFSFITNDFKAKHQRILNREQLIDYIEDVSLSPNVKKQSEVYSRLKEVMKEGDAEQFHVYFLSDFQKLTTDLGEIIADSTIFLNLNPLKAVKTSNLYIDSCWFDSPVRQYRQPEKLMVRIKNSSDKVFDDVPLSLNINGQAKTPATFSVKANDEVLVPLTYTNNNFGIQKGKISLDDYPVTFDDDFFFSYEVVEEINVLSLFEDGLGKNDALARLYESDSLFNFREINIGNMDYALLNKSDVVILNGLNNIPSGLSRELGKLTENGGSLVVFPGIEIEKNSYKQFLGSLNTDQYLNKDTAGTKVDDINLQHPLFSSVFEDIPKNIDLPVVDSYYRISKITRTGKENILGLRNGREFFNEYPYGKGKVYMSAVPLDSDYSNFTNHAIFVPLLYNIGIYSSKTQQLFYTIGDDNLIKIDHRRGDENVYHLKGNDIDFIPELRVVENKPRLFLHNQIKEAGNYAVTYKEETIKGVSFNYSRNESDMSFYKTEELQDLLKIADKENYKILELKGENITQKVSIINEGRQLWKLCIILVLIFVGIEVLLLKFWKK